jgi:uncharacterized protein
MVTAPLLFLLGRNGSGPQHWQTLWQARPPGALRLQPSDWSNPELGDWMSALERAVAACASPPLLAAHSMGCLLSVCWAAQHQSDRPIRGAFLAAPPDFGRDGFPSRSFAHVPDFPIACPLLVVASSNDPYCPIEVAEQMADRWDAGFVCIGARGAGLLLLAAAVTAAYFVIAFLFPRLIQLLPGSPVSTEQDNDITHD